MRRAFTYCSICGCPFHSLRLEADIRGDDGPYTYDSAVLASEDTRWLRLHAGDQPPLGGDADADAEEALDSIAALVRHVERSQGWADDVGWEMFGACDATGTTYPMHSTCMAIAEHTRRRQFFRHAQPAPSPKAVLQDFSASLKRLHYRIRGHGNGVRWDHGYYGAARYWVNLWGQERGWEWLCADPIHIENLTPWVLSQLRDASESESRQPMDVAPEDEANYPRAALDGMPIDVLNRITSYLPTASVLRLRRCSKPLVNRIELSQTFWRDRLISGDLVEFLWDLDEEKCRQKDRSLSDAQWNWRGLAQSLRSHKFVEAALRQSMKKGLVEGYGIGYLDFYRSVAAEADGSIEDAPIGLLNRCRIVQIVKDVEAIEEDELHDCHAPLSHDEELYAAMWIIQTTKPEKFDEYRIKRSLELYGDLSDVLESRPRFLCRL